MTGTNNKGFSLIELMIVVAIIGILSAIAIPNFQRFQMKSRQSEAKNALSAIFQAEKAYHQEWSQYFADFRDIGYAPEGVMKYYVTSSDAAGVNTPGNLSGYNGPSGPNSAPTVYNTGGYCDAAAYANISVCNMDTDYATAAAISDADGQAGTMNINSFLAAAGSDLDRGKDTTYDVWTINQNKQMANVTNDAAD